MKIFDLTKNIELEGSSLKQYRKARAGLYSVFFLGFVYFIIFCLLFPNQNYFFSFDNNSNRNFNLELKNDDFSLIGDGRISTQKISQFNVPLDGDFSRMNISIDVDQRLSTNTLAEIKIRRSFQAFFYPDGEPVGFKNGWLLKNGTDYYIVSQDKFRKFNNLALLEDMGYDEKAFVTIEADELKYNLPGEAIIAANIYPDSSLFEINGGFYILKNGELHQFISQKAYETNYKINQAIKKNDDFLGNYPLSEEQVGFSDRSLIANPDAVFVVNGNTLLAIGSVDVFSIKGFSWDDVIQATPDEMAFYPNVSRAKIFSDMSAHSNGTVLKDKESERLYLVKNNQKLPIFSKNIFQSWSNEAPILVSENSLTVYDDCELVKSFWKKARYSCKINIENLSIFPGTDYQIELYPKDEARINYIDMTFKKNLSKYNLKNTFNLLVNQLIKNYGSKS